MSYQTQKTLVKNHLEKHNSISDKTAYDEYGVRRLSAVIYKLKNEDGMSIASIPARGKNRLGKDVNFVYYTLVR